MRALGLAAFLLAFSLLALPVSAQQTTSTSSSPAVSDPQAVALLQQSLAALTGGEAVTDVTLTGAARRIAGSDDETGTATLKATAASDSRVDLSFPSGQRTEIRNHAALPLADSLPPGVPATVAQTPQPVGEWLGPDGAPHGMAGHNIMIDAAWFFPALTLARLATQPNSVFSYLGQETHDGQPTMHISALQSFPQAPSQIATVMQHLTQMDVYLDPTSMLPIALSFNVHPDNDALADIATEVRFSDYRAVNGVQVPFYLQKYLNHGLVLDLQFDNISLNTGLASAAFEIQ